jgi:hypothetical protein
MFRKIEMLRNEKNDYSLAGNQRSAMPDRQPRKYVGRKRPEVNQQGGTGP